LDMVHKVNADRAAIEALRTELDSTKNENDAVRNERNAIYAKLDAVKDAIEASKAVSTKLVNQRNEVYNKLRDLGDDRDKIFEDRKVFREKAKEERREQQEKEWQKEQERRAEEKRKWEERQVERKKKQEEWAKRDEERKTQDMLRNPYEEDIILCERLVEYLETLLPKREAPAPPPPPKVDVEIEGATILKREVEPDGIPKFKKKGPAVKKEKERKPHQDIRLNVEIFIHFESLSLNPPMKFSEIPKSIADLKEKKEHLTKLAEAKLEGNKALIAAKAAAKSAPAPDASAAPVQSSEEKPAQKEEENSIVAPTNEVVA